MDYKEPRLLNQKTQTNKRTHQQTNRQVCIVESEDTDIQTDTLTPKQTRTSITESEDTDIQTDTLTDKQYY